MIRIDSLWLAVEPTDMRAGAERLLASVVQEEFQLFWEYDSPAWAAKFLDAWCKRAMRSRIDPVKKFLIRNELPPSSSIELLAA